MKALIYTDELLGVAEPPDPDAGRRTGRPPGNRCGTWGPDLHALAQG